MKFTTGIVSFLLTSGLTAALPTQNIQKRTAATVLTDINTISGYVAALTSAAKTYTGSRLQSFALALIVDNLEDSLTTATTDTTASAAFDSSDSDNILTAITVLTPNFVTLLDDLETIVCSSTLRCKRPLTCKIRLQLLPRLDTPQVF
jgi:chemotaxis signal transduction protein